MNHFSHIKRSQSKYLAVLFIYTLLFAFAMPDSTVLWTNFLKLFTLQTHLLQDFFALVGSSATYFNVSLHYLIAFLLIYTQHSVKITSLQLSALGIFIGHSFFGTHILNILPILLGVYLYSRWVKQPYRRFKTMSLFATATAPLVSFLWTATSLPPTMAIILGCVVGISLGFISSPLAEHFLKFHQGFSLYNYGFTTGIIAMFMVILLPYLKLSIPRSVILSQDATAYHMIYMLGVLLLCGIVASRNISYTLSKYPKLLSHSGRVPDDFVSSFGTPVAFFNMTVTGLTYTLLLYILQAPFNGPTIGGLCTIIGFSAFGKHIYNCLPISFGVIIAAILSQQPLTDISVILPLLFGTGLAPISGYYGLLAGITAGFLQFHITGIVLPLHQGMTLYNNGFSAGFIAAFLVPIIEIMDERREHDN